MEKLAFPAEVAPDIINHWSEWIQDGDSGWYKKGHPEWTYEPNSAKVREAFADLPGPPPELLEREIIRRESVNHPQGPKKKSLARTGSQNGRTTLDEIDVCFMRSMHKIWGLSIAEISRRRKVPNTTVRDIIRRKTWTHV
jgi:hypothetical protein